MKKLFLIFLIIQFVALSAYSEKSEKSSGKSAKGSFRIRHGRVIEAHPTLPIGFESGDLDPGIVTIGIQTQFVGIGSNPRLDLALTFLKSIKPQLSVQLDYPYRLSSGELTFGIESIFNFEDQSPISPSQFDYFLLGAFLGLKLDFGIIHPKVEYRYRQAFSALISQQENIETKVGRNADQVLTGEVEIHLGPLKAIGGWRHFIFGSAAVASKEFSAPIPGLSINQASLGAGINLKSFEIIVTYYRVMDSISDLDAFYITAPHFYPYYLLAKDSAFAEVKWNF